MNQEEGSHQISNLLALIWDFPVPELIKEVATGGKGKDFVFSTGLGFKNALGSWRWRVSLVNAHTCVCVCARAHAPAYGWGKSRMR